MSAEEWCRLKLANLHIEEHRLDTLNEIKNHLSELPANVAADVGSSILTNPEVFDCVEDVAKPDRNVQQNDLACEILSICMTNLKLVHTENSYYLERSLQHANPEVQYLGLYEMRRVLKENPNKKYNSTIVISLIKCLESSLLHIGTLAVKILRVLLAKSLNDKSVKLNLEKILAGATDLVKCRVYVVAVHSAKESIETLNKLDSILKIFIADLDTSDILLQINVLDLLSELALSDHGLAYLENKGVFAKITRNIQTLDENPMKTILIPNYMKFYGNIATKQPAKVIKDFPQMMNSLFDCILDSDASTLPVAFDTLGQIARTPIGKMLLHETYPAKLRETLNEIGKSIHNLTTELQVRALNSLTTIFDCYEYTHRLSAVLEIWFNWLTGTNGQSFLLDFCRNPFPEIKVAALKLLAAVCGFPWGQKGFYETAGFLEFLLDRYTEFNKDAVHEKYKCIEVLSKSVQCDHNTVRILRRYLQEGAFYVSGAMDVATEGQE